MHKELFLNVKYKKIYIFFLFLIFLFIILIGFKIYLANERKAKEKPLDLSKISAESEKSPELIKREEIVNERIEKTEAIAIKNEEFLIKQKSKEKIEFILPVTYQLSIEDCEKIIDGQFKRDCQTYFQIRAAVKAQDISVCAQLKNEWEDACRYEVAAVKSDNQNLCADIKDELLHDKCLLGIAISQNDPMVCPRLYAGVESCKDKVRSINNEFGDSILNCAVIKKAEYFLMCVNGNSDDCALLGDEYLVNRCISWRFFGTIIASGAKEDCIALPLEEFRKTCESYFDNNKKFIDTDGDGVNDNQELFCDTNPLVYGEDAKINLQYEERWSAVLENIYYKTQGRLSDLALDTDDDGLRDYEEKEVYKTDFNNPDTDGDGHKDGAEVKNGYDPLAI